MPTHDLDFFTSPNKATVQDACAAFVDAATERGWTIRLLHELGDHGGGAVVRGAAPPAEKGPVGALLLLAGGSQDVAAAGLAGACTTN